LCQHRSLLRQLYCAAYDEGAETPKIQELFALYKEKRIQIKFEKKEKNRIKYIFDLNLVLLNKMLLFVSSFHFKFK
jgi:hypothetical protein